MWAISGLIIVVTMVFGGFTLAGGTPDVLLKAGPAEFAIIAGAGLGTLLIGNSRRVALSAMAAPVRIVQGPVWSRQGYGRLGAMLVDTLGTARRQGIRALDRDIETPDQSERFGRVAELSTDTDARSIVCDFLLRLGLGPLSPNEAEALLQRRLDTAMAERSRPVVALERLADALPALGIVAAVLGVIKSLAAVDQSTAVLGGMIASALVGTFLGVFLAYGIVAPIASRYAQIVEEDARALSVVADSLLAWHGGQDARGAVEAGLGLLPGDMRPELSAVAVALPIRRKRASTAA